MKIVEVTHRFPPNHGGVERHVEQITKHLSKRHDVTVITADSYDVGTDTEQQNGVEVKRFPAVSPRSNYYLSLSLIKAVRNIDADVVHVHNYHAMPSVTAALSTDDPVVFTPHYHGVSRSRFRNFLLSVYKYPGRRSLLKSDQIVSVSDWEMDKLSRDMRLVDGIKVIPHGLDYDRFSSPTRPPYVPHDQPYILSVGRIDEYKNVHLAIQALNVLEDMILVIIGAGPAKQKIQDYADQLGVERRCIYMGEVDDEMLVSFYANAEVTVNCSTIESFGMNVGESLAAGTPVVAAPYRGLLRWTGTDGVVFADAEEPDVASTVQVAMDKQVDRRPLPTWEDVAEEVEATMEKVA